MWVTLLNFLKKNNFICYIPKSELQSSAKQYFFKRLRLQYIDYQIITLISHVNRVCTRYSCLSYLSCSYYSQRSSHLRITWQGNTAGDANRLYKKIRQTRALYLFNLMSRLIVHSSDDDSRGWRGAGDGGTWPVTRREIKTFRYYFHFAGST